MDMDELSKMAFGLAMYDSYQSAMEKSRKAAENVGGSVADTLPERIYHALLDNRQRGPFTLGEIAALIAAGELTAEGYVWKQGLADWLPARELPELADRFHAEAKKNEEEQP